MKTKDKRLLVSLANFIKLLRNDGPYGHILNPSLIKFKFKLTLTRPNLLLNTRHQNLTHDGV